MAEWFDVTGRLAEGLPAVEHTQSYVSACHDPTPIRDLYSSEDGLDLRALDADCAALRAAAALAAEALRLQRDQLAALPGVWAGAGADSAVAFLQRHCDAAVAVVAEIRAAARRCESLRDGLWDLVDAKVATVIAIDDRTLPHQPAWLAAAAAATTDAAAQQIVNQQIKPYVDNDIRHDWLTAMHSNRACVTACYDTVTDQFAATPRAHFESPVDFGPSSPPPRSPGSPAPVAAAVAPATFSRPSVSAPVQTPNSPLVQPEWGQGVSESSGMAGVDSGLGDGGELDSADGSGGAGGLGGAGVLGGLASRIVQAIDSLLGAATDQAGYADEPLDEEGEQDDPDEPEPGQTEKPEATKAFEPTGQVGGPVTVAAQPVPEAPRPVPEESPPPVQAGAPPVQGAEPVIAPAKPPLPPGATPCEIAANELPQAGQ